MENILSVLLVSIISFAVLTSLLSGIQTTWGVEKWELERASSVISLRAMEKLSVAYVTENGNDTFVLLKNCGDVETYVKRVYVRRKNDSVSLVLSDGSLADPSSDGGMNFSLPPDDVKVLSIKGNGFEEIIVRTEYGNVFEFVI